MRHLLYILIFIFFTPLFIFSQVQQEWANYYPQQISCNAGAYDMILDNFGNVYVTGYTECSYGGYCTLKYNSSGSQLWVSYYNPNNGSGRFANALALDSILNVYVTGYSYADTSLFDYCTVKYNSNGVQQWVRYFDSSHGIDEAKKIVVDKAGNIYVAGVGSGNHYATLKYSTDGNIIWERDYGGYGGTGVTDMAVDDRCNIYITGTYTVKYDSSGNLKWSDIILYGAGYSITLDNNYNVYIGGDSTSISSPEIDLITIKYSITGNREWTKRYNPDSTYGRYQATTIRVDSLGCIFVAGWYGLISGQQICLVKYTNSGDLLWAIKDTALLSSQNSTMSLDKRSNIYISGPKAYPYSFFTIKYDSSGVEKWRYIDTAGYSIAQLRLDDNFNLFATGSSHYCCRIYTVKYSQPLGINKITNEIPGKFELHQNYPNPFNPTTKIKFSIPHPLPLSNSISEGNVVLVVYDILGREVTTLVNESAAGGLKPGTYEVEFDGSKLSSGVYFYKLQTEEFTNTKRMVLIK